MRNTGCSWPFLSQFPPNFLNQHTWLDLESKFDGNRMIGWISIEFDSFASGRIIRLSSQLEARPPTDLTLSIDFPQCSSDSAVVYHIKNKISDLNVLKSSWFGCNLHEASVWATLAHLRVSGGHPCRMAANMIAATRTATILGHPMIIIVFAAHSRHSSCVGANWASPEAARLHQRHLCRSLFQGSSKNRFIVLKPCVLATLQPLLLFRYGSLQTMRPSPPGGTW